jgi:hypothetical protein
MTDAVCDLGSALNAPLRRLPGRPVPGAVAAVRREHDEEPDRRAEDCSQQKVGEPELVPRHLLLCAAAREDESLLFALGRLSRLLAHSLGHDSSLLRSYVASLRPTELRSSMSSSP